MTNLSCPKCGARQDLHSVTATVLLSGQPLCVSCSKPLPQSLLAQTAAADANANELQRRQALALIAS